MLLLESIIWSTIGGILTLTPRYFDIMDNEVLDILPRYSPFQFVWVFLDSMLPQYMPLSVSQFHTFRLDRQKKI